MLIGALIVFSFVINDVAHVVSQGNRWIILLFKWVVYFLILWALYSKISKVLANISSFTLSKTKENCAAKSGVTSDEPGKNQQCEKRDLLKKSSIQSKGDEIKSKLKSRR